MKRYQKAVLATLIGSCFGPAQSIAQSDSAAGLEEVVVTASRRSESLQESSITVSAISEETIHEMGLSNIEDFISLIPGAVVESGAFGLDDRINIRATSGPGFDFMEQGTGIYRNDYYIGGVRTVFSDMVDLERVEVLRGPQGGLYGRNAVGGAVNFIYKRPSFDGLEGDAQLSYGTFDRLEARGVINVPVVEEKFALRAAGWIINQDEGEYYNETLGEYADDEEIAGIRVTGLAQISDTISDSFEFEVSNEKGYENVSAFETSLAAGWPTGIETGKRIRRDTPSEAERDYTFFGNTLNFETDMGMLSFITSYREFELESISDQDFTQFHAAEIARSESVESTFIEGRWVSPVEWPVSFVAGVTWFDEDVRLDRRNTSFDLATDLPNGFGNGDHLVGTESLAWWGEATWTISDNLKAFFSARYTDEEKTLDFDQDVTAGALLDYQISGLKANFTNTSLGGGISWQITDDIQLYTRINEGFRPGGFNTLLTTSAAGTVATANDETVTELLDYSEETSVNYEVGVKSTWFDNRLKFNLAAYHLDQEDLIIGLFDFGTFIFLYDNAGESETNGIDVELAAMITDNFVISGSYGAINGRVTEITSADFPTSGLNGGKVNTASLNASYELELSDSLDLRLGADWRYRNDRNTFLFQGVPFGQEYGVFGASIALVSESWELALLGENLNDDDHAISFAVLGPIAVNRADGRTVTLRFSAKF